MVCIQHNLHGCPWTLFSIFPCWYFCRFFSTSMGPVDLKSESHHGHYIRLNTWGNDSPCNMQWDIVRKLKNQSSKVWLWLSPGFLLVLRLDFKHYILMPFTLSLCGCCQSSAWVQVSLSADHMFISRRQLLLLTLCEESVYIQCVEIWITYL